MKLLREFIAEKYTDIIKVLLIVPIWYVLRYPSYDEAVWGRWGSILTFAAFVVAPVWLVHAFYTFVKNRKK